MILQHTRRRRRLGQLVPDSGVYAPGSVLTPSTSSLNLPESTPLTIDPNAGAIAAEQAANWIPDEPYSSGSLWDSLFGGSGGVGGLGGSTGTNFLVLAGFGAVVLILLLKK